KEVEAGTFREDLYFRLSVFRIDIPPLRQRREDLPALADALVRELSAELGRRSTKLSAKGLKRLMAYDFPGNVRELRNVLERALVLERGPELDLEGLQSGPRAGAPGSAVASDAFVFPDPIQPLEAVE